jgi:hypothetical protein
MLTASGRKVHPAAIRAADIAIEDIAHHLAMLCRFTGACRRFYSVAEHSLLVADILAAEAPHDARLQLCGLLHDAPEYLLGDFATPLKDQLPAYRVIERGAWSAVAQAFGLPDPQPAAVKHADLVALALERRELMPAHPDEWPCFQGLEVGARAAALPSARCIGYGPLVVAHAFLARFRALA